MTTQLRTEIETYLSTEKRLNNAIERYNAYVDADTEVSEMYSKQIDVLENRLKSQVEMASKGLNISIEEFINLVNEA